MIYRLIKRTAVILPVSLMLFSAVAQADITVSFVESAPKDRFEIKNTGSCDIASAVVTVDLTGSAGKLVFDTTASGAGVQVFQPFEVREGELSLISANQVSDGDKALSVSVNNLPAGKLASFTIDVDDTLPKSQLGMIRVTDSEIKGGQITVEMSGKTSSAQFNDQGVAAIPESNCK